MRTLRFALPLLLIASPALSAQDSGCGLGSLIIQKNTIISQTASMTTNGSFSSQFFGITSGTSNCSSNGFAFREKEAEVYAESHLPELQVEMARGSGENLDAFALLLGCRGDALSKFGEFTRSRSGAILSAEKTTPASFLTGVKGELSKETLFREGCQIAG